MGDEAAADLDAPVAIDDPSAFPPLIFSQRACWAARIFRSVVGESFRPLREELFDVDLIDDAPVAPTGPVPPRSEFRRCWRDLICSLSCRASRS